MKSYFQRTRFVRKVDGFLADAKLNILFFIKHSIFYEAITQLSFFTLIRDSRNVLLLLLTPFTSWLFLYKQMRAYFKAELFIVKPLYYSFSFLGFCSVKRIMFISDLTVYNYVTQNAVSQQFNRPLNTSKYKGNPWRDWMYLYLQTLLTN